MFQLLRAGGSYLEISGSLSLRSLSGNSRLDPTEKTCLLCKRLNINYRLQFREQSSITNLNVNRTKKKRLKHKKQGTYTDILEVNGKFPRFKKANITKLTPSDLNLLTSSNINLSELYKVKQVDRNVSKFVPHTYSNLSVEGIAGALVPLKFITDPSVVNPKVNINKIAANKIDHEKAFSEEPDLENEFELESLAVRDSLQPEIIEEPPEVITLEDPKQQEKQHVEKCTVSQVHRDAIAAQTLAAYIEVCNHLKNPRRGFLAFKYHQTRAEKELSARISIIKNTNVYYTLLKGFANKADYIKLQHIVEMAEKAKVELDMHCYIAIFECLGRMDKNHNYTKDVARFVQEASKKNITFDKMMSDGVFLNDERSYVLKALKTYYPSYVAKFDKTKLWYKNHLVNHLNNDHQLNFKVAESKGNREFITPIVMNELIEKQVTLEENGYIAIKSIQNYAQPTQEIERYRQALNEHYRLWAESARSAFNRDLATLSAQRSAFSLEPYLRSIPIKEFVDIIVQEATKLAQGSETYSPEAYVLYKMLGLRVYARYRILKKQKGGVLEKTLQIHTKYCKHYAATHTELDVVPHEEVYTNPRIQWQTLEQEMHGQGPTLNMGHQPWVPVTLTAIGKFLYHIIMHDLNIDVNSLRPNSKHKNFLPAFYTIFRNQGRIVKHEIKPHPVLSKLYKMSQPETLTFPANEVPMLCPPIPWTCVGNGGYIITSTDVVRLPFQASSQKLRMAEADPAQLYPNFDALNQLAAVPWKVNTQVLDIILQVFRSGGSSKLDVPKPPSSLPPPQSTAAEADKLGKYQIFKQKLQHRRKQAEMYSLWCDCLYRLSLANHFRDDVFWLPHNMDFRGRVYPVPPHLNHLGSDLARSILIFAESRPLGPEGLDWLKIHLINLTGLKKRDSIKDRLDYANEIIDLILDSADHPLTGKKWWAESDEPWQSLACCMEIANVMRSGRDPAEYRSHFPVHQDGSCNGLQHYAALGRDSAGAYSVNLTASVVPQDVYSAVVSLVEKQRAKEEKNGLEIAKVLNGFVKRKVIKQTIMTTVYGVTRYGARLQIAKQLKDIDDFPKDFVWSASSYLTSRTFDSLRTMFTSTREIQDWFTECARLISGVDGSLVEWVTPLGLPIVQPYIKYKKSTMPCGYEGFSLDQFEKPNVMKQKNAFPPNFIHSLDSSHMMLTSLHCERSGITFVSVHDCYWTHPSTIHIMNKICREQFVALHSEPILEDLSRFLYNKYSYDSASLKQDGSVAEQSKKKLNKVLKKLPKKGDFDIKNILKSIYFFS